MTRPFLVVILLAVCALTAAEGASVVSQISVRDIAAHRGKHNTQRYRGVDQRYLVCRRGNDIEFQITTDSPLVNGQTLQVGATPGEAAIIASSVNVVPNVGGGTTHLFTLSVKPTAPVGTFQLTFRVSGQGRVTNYPLPLAVLFNPWNELDDTFLANAAERDEYVNNEWGIIWTGSRHNQSGRKWYYGQFSPEALVAALFFVDRLPVSVRSSPKDVSRHLSFSVTYQTGNPNGLVMGSWDKVIIGGVNPTAWTGSDQILKRYINSGMRVVKFAQCWVFGGLLNTLLRTMGVPSRQITTFDSAHESPDVPGIYKNEIVRYWDARTRRLVREKGMIWNFHSWNEAWFKRSDVPAPYNQAAFNAVDSTPQELSEGKFQCGPSSVRAVNDRVVGLPHDTSFVISEVDSKVRSYLMSCTFPGVTNTCSIVRDMGVDPGTVTGSSIVTKAVGSYAQLPITDTYNGKRAVFASAVGGSNMRFPSTMAMLNRGNRRARRRTNRAFSLLNVDRKQSHMFRTEHVRVREFSTMNANATASVSNSTATNETSSTGDVIRMITQVENTEVGSPIRLYASFQCRNEQRVNGTCDIHLLSVRVVAYFAEFTGKTRAPIQAFSSRIALRQKTNFMQNVTFSFDQYYKQEFYPLDSYVKFSIYAIDHNTQNVATAVEDTHLSAPPLLVRVGEGEITMNSTRKVPFFVTLDNPLPIALTNCSVTIRGVYMNIDETLHEKTVQIGETFRFVGEIDPNMIEKAGKSSILASMSCTEIADMNGSKQIRLLHAGTITPQPSVSSSRDMDRDTAEDHVVAPSTNTTVPRNDDRSSTSHSNGNSVSNSPERGEGGSDDGFRERANPSPGRPSNAPDAPATTTETVSTTGERTSADEREVVPVEVTTPDTPRADNEGATAASPRVDLNTTFEEIVRSADGEGSSDATLEMSIDARGNIREEGRAH